MKKKYDVIGMTCSACQAHVDKAVRGVSGVQEVNVNLLQNTMTVEFDDNQVTDEQIFDAVDKAGYKAQNIGETTISVKKQDENEHKKKDLILSFIFLIPLFYISMGHMLNWPLPSILLGHENMMIFVLVQLGLVIATALSATFLPALTRHLTNRIYRQFLQTAKIYLRLTTALASSW